MVQKATQTTDMRSYQEEQRQERKDAEASRYDIQRTLGRIESKLESVGEALVVHTKDDHYNFEAMSQKIELINRNMFKALGVISFLGVAIPVAIAYFRVN